MQTTFLVSALVVTLGCANAYGESMAVGPPSINCGESDGYGCLLVLSRMPERGYFRLQRADPSDGKWRQVGSVRRQRKELATDPTPGGYLYLVETCDGPSNRAICSASPVLWIPLQPVRADEIPATVANPDGGIYTVSKHMSLETQTKQYNVYLLERLISLLDGPASEWPPMTPPPAGAVRTSRELRGRPTYDKIQNYMFGIYEARRTGT